MKTVLHVSAKPAHYNKESKSYDAFNDDNSKIINNTIEYILKRYQVKSVFDLTCGTGSQVFYLSERGYDVVGSDINLKMLNIAKKKAQQKNIAIKFIKGDMRTTIAGHFDAVVTIFNAIGHLTKSDFEKAIKNIYNNLKNSGIYIFDIFNLAYLLDADNITNLTIDWQRMIDNKKIREIQFSTIDEEGTLASYDLYCTQEGTQKPRFSRSFQTLQVYTREQLKKMLEENGFEVLSQSAIDGSEIIENESDRILTVARARA
jgi:2-polyprenyl-3-methyl-5-hydroxy-6-metoxy-1,4-benzoquinol methylase